MAARLRLAPVGRARGQVGRTGAAHAGQRGPASSSSPRPSTGRTTSPPSRRSSPSTRPSSTPSRVACTSMRTACTRSGTRRAGSRPGTWRCTSPIDSPARSSLAAGFDVAPGPDGFWAQLARNVAHVPVLNAWGGKDPLVIRDLAEKPAGTFAESNRWFDRRRCAGWGCRSPTSRSSAACTTSSRPRARPSSTSSTGAGPWIRRASATSSATCTRRRATGSRASPGSVIRGASRGRRRAAARPGESEAAALARTLEPLLGRLTGVREGRPSASRAGTSATSSSGSASGQSSGIEPVVDGMRRQARLFGEARAGCRVSRSRRAKATMDFERLVFAGIRVSASGEASVVTAATMPEPAWRR